MRAREELRELRLGPRGAGEIATSGAARSRRDDDVGCEEPQLLALVGRGGERARSLLLGYRPRVGSADGARDELAEQCALVAEARVDVSSETPAAAAIAAMLAPVVTPLLEERRGGVEHALPRLLGLLAPPLRAVGASA